MCGSATNRQAKITNLNLPHKRLTLRALPTFGPRTFQVMRETEKKERPMPGFGDMSWCGIYALMVVCEFLGGVVI